MSLGAAIGIVFGILVTLAVCLWLITRSPRPAPQTERLAMKRHLAKRYPPEEE